MYSFRFDDPDQYTKGTPYPEFARLRQHSPFSWHLSATSKGDGFWLATKYKDIVSISKKPELFASYAPLLSDPLPPHLWSTFPSLAMIADNLMTFAPPKHAVFKACVVELFSGKNVVKIEHAIRTICRSIIGQIATKLQFDFATDVALPIPSAVVLEQFLGIPREDLAKIVDCVFAINAMDDPFFRPKIDTFLQSADTLFAYGNKLLDRVLKTPTDTIFSAIVHSQQMNDYSKKEAFLAYWFPLIAGAFDTTASTIAGGIHALLSFPDQHRLLQNDRSLIPLAVDEFLRWTSPVIYFRRTATANIAHNGFNIEKGQKILLCYASANRDEDIFTTPDKFDIKRSPNSHLAFGYGPHYCLGARLSSLIIRIFLEEFLDKIPALKLNGEVIRTRSAWMNRIRSMPVTTQFVPDSLQ